ncbi:hypothetical protein E2C01_010041 [Portunus trituberculatus]|uniref:Uncharacterized protein n=1 Tax=Portunus trituberculatus TaxID=210409 RepID=A0A5B7D7F6_PORTR|nr:hypothetical protein [Portunus trituberculatus]
MQGYGKDSGVNHNAEANSRIVEPPQKAPDAVESVDEGDAGVLRIERVCVGLPYPTEHLGSATQEESSSGEDAIICLQSVPQSVVPGYMEVSPSCRMYREKKVGYTGLDTGCVEVDMTGTVMTVSSQRMSVMDFSSPLFMDFQTLIYSKPSFESDLLGFVKPYTLQVWLCLAGALVVVSTGTFLTHKIRFRLLHFTSTDR